MANRWGNNRNSDKLYFLQLQNYYRWRLLLLLLSLFSRVWLHATPQTAAHQALLSLGFSRQGYWSGLPFSSPMHACMLSYFSCVRLYVTLWTATHQAPLSSGFSRQEYWSGLPFPSPENGDYSHEIKICLLLGKKAMTNLDSILPTKACLFYGFSSSHVWMWELDYKESWVLKNWCFWTVVLEKTLESPLDCKEIQKVRPQENKSWLFIGRTDAKTETPILWLPDVKNWLNGKDPDAGKDWRQEEKGITEDEIVGWHHQLSGHEFEQALGVGDGQRSLACYSTWSHKELDMTEQLNWTDIVQ